MTSYNYRFGSTVGTGQNVSFGAKIFKKDARKPNILKFGIRKNTSLLLGDDIYYYDLDNNNIFKGELQKINDGDGIQYLEVADYSVQLSQVQVNEIFDGGTYTPEGIIEYIIDNYTDLTFVNNLTITNSTISTTIKRSDIWAINVINEMLELFNGGFTVDINKNFYLYQIQDSECPYNLMYGIDKISSNWETDIQSKAEKVIVKGAFIDQRTTETLSGTGTTFYTTYIPENIQISGKTQTTSQIDGDYDVDKENRKITFESSQTDPEVNYTYQSQIRVEIGTGKTVTLEKKYITSKTEAIKLAREYKSRFEDGTQSSKWIKVSSDINSFNVGDSIFVTDNYNNKTGSYTIQEVEFQLPNKMFLKIGEEEDDLFDWQKEAIDRIKQLEDKSQNSGFVTKFDYIERGVKVSIDIEFTTLESYVDDGTILWASDTTLSTDADLISDTGIDDDYALAYDDAAVPSENYIDYLA